MRIMHQDLHMFPYKIQILQAQTAADKAERLAFCQSIIRRIEDHPTFLDLIFFSDEAHFDLSGQGYSFVRHRAQWHNRTILV